MLKAYSYVNCEWFDADIVDSDIFSMERQIIYEFVKNNPIPKKEIPCVICGGKTSSFDTIDNVYFQRCSECYSIFASVEKEIISRYKEYKPLLNFRCSDEYQCSAAEKRKGIWNELLFWLEYRLARYTGKNSGLDVIDICNRYVMLMDKIKNAGFCGSYNAVETADVVLYFDQFRCQSDPMETLSELKGMLKNDGLLIMNMRVGSGFDILALKGNADHLFPYESVLLPSTEGLCIIFKKAGLDVLEISTPGTLDVEHVQNNKKYIDPDDLFVNYLLNKTDKSVLAEFQRFLQKNGMSSHARIIARKS